MKAELLLEHFHRLGDAPDAVPRLRRFILDLAVRGKLVEQDERDEPAKALLKKIAKEKAEYPAGRKKEFTVEPITEGEERFDLPASWTWARTNDVTVYVQRGKSPKYSLEKKVPVIAQKCVQWSGFQLEKAQFIEPATLSAYGEERYVQDGDLLWNSTGHGSLGRIIVFKERFKGKYPIIVADSHVTVIRPSKSINPDYLFCWFAGPLVQDEINDKSTGTTNQTELPVGTVLAYDIPLPPLPEQHRIVAKVEELMALCDRLEAAQQQREAERTRLTAAAWQAVVQAEAPADVSFALEQLAALTTRPAQVKALRQTILDLAVRGRLVEQDEGDEPAEVLLGRIRKKKERLVKEGKIKRQEVLDIDDDDELPMEIPAHWKWVRFAAIASIQSNLVNPKKFLKHPHIAPDNIQSWTGRLLPYQSIQAAGVFSGKHYFEPGVILYSKIRPALAKAVTVDFEGLCSADMYPILPFIDRAFLHKYMLTPAFVEQTQNEDNRVAMPKINQLALSKILVPLPPLAEQRRIVAKVDKLMALCDRLEAALAAGEALRGKVLEAVVRSDDQKIRRSDNAPRPAVVQKPKVRVPRYVEPEPEVELAVAAEPVGHAGALQAVVRRGPGRPPKNGALTSTAARAIEAWLQAHPGWHGKAAILAATGVDAGAWNAAIKALLEAGKVERQGEKRGARYRAA